MPVIHTMSQPPPAPLTASGLTAFLHEQIPLSRAMDLHVAECGPGHLVLEAPLEPNKNHLGTAFGGSLHVLPTLTCYTGLWLTLRAAGLDGHVVLTHSRADYHEPVTGPLRAIWQHPGDATLSDWLRKVRRYKKARIELSATVEGTADRPAVEFRGMFAAVL